MKIYTVHGNKVHELEVTETDKMYIAKKGRDLAFDCKLNFRKEDCATSPLDAITMKIREVNTDRRILTSQVHEIDPELNTLHKLAEKYK